MQVPVQFRRYPCDDYFASQWAERGCWDDPSQLMLIVPTTGVEERPELSFLVIGRPGVDGIEFGYRTSSEGLWAYYSIEGEFTFIALTTAELVEDYLSGKLTV